MGILATSQITIVDLNDQISLSSYITSNSPKVQFITTGGAYTPNYESAPVILNAELYKIGTSGNNVISCAEVKNVTWHVKMAQETNWTELTSANIGSNYEIITHDGKPSSLKVKKNLMNKNNTAMAIQCRIHYQEAWMPETHIQKSEIDFSLSVQGNTGAAGQDSYTVVLSNESHSILCNSAGVPDAGEIGANGRAKSDIIVYKGATKLTPVADSATPTTNQFKYRIVTQEGCTASRTDNDTFYIGSLATPSATLNISTDGKSKIDIVEDKGMLTSSSVQETGFVEVEITCENKQTIRKLMTFSKVKAGSNGSDGADGSDGAPAQFITVNTTDQIFKYPKGTTSPTPSAITLTAELHNVSAETIIWKQKDTNGAWVNASGTNNTLTYSVSPSAVEFNGRTAVTYRCYVNTVLTDEVTISKLIDGDDAYTVLLSNESHTVACTADGTLKSGELAKIMSDIKVYRGTTVLAGAATASTGKFSYAIGTITPSSGCTVARHDDDTFKVTALTVDAASINVTINCEGKQSFTKTMTVSKSRDGATGEEAYVATLTNDFHSVPTKADGSGAVLTGCETSIELFKGSSKVTSGVTYAKANETGITGTLTGNKYVVTAISADTAYVDLTATYNSRVFTKRFTVTKNKQGISGTTPLVYWLISSAGVVNKSKTGLMTPSTLVFEGRRRNGTAAIEAYAAKYKIFVSTDGTTWPTTPNYTSTSGEVSKAFSVPSNAKAIKCQMFISDGVTKVDENLIPVSEDGIDGIDAINVALTGEQVIKYADTNYSGTPTPSQVVIASSIQGVNTPARTWEYKVPGGNWTAITASNTANDPTFTLTHNNSIWGSHKSITVRCTANGHSDEHTVYKVADGTTSYTVALSNESHTVACENNGTPLSGELAKATTQIIAYKGATKITPTVTQVTAETSGCTATVTNTAITVTAMSADTAKVTVDVACEGKQTIRKVFSLVKSKKALNGNNGANAKVVTVTGEQTFKYPAASSTPSNTSIVLTRTMQGVSGGKWQFFNSKASTPAWADFNPVQTGETVTITHNMANTDFADASKKQMRVRYVASDNATFDELTIAKLQDGTHGTNAYTVVLSNESHTLIAENNGSVSQAEIDKAFSLIQAFKGTATASFTASLVTAETTGGTAEITGGNKLQLKTITADSAKLTVDVRVDNAQTVRKVMTITKAKKGATGAAALALDITGEQVFSYDAAGTVSPANIQLKATGKNFTVASNNIKWEVMNGNTVAHVLAPTGGGTSPTITPSTPGWNKDILKVRATYTSNTSIYDEHTITIVRDGKNPIMSYIWAPNGNTIKNDDRQTIDVEAVLFWGSTDKTQDANTQYRWVKVAPNGTETPLKPATAGQTVAGNANGYKCTVTADEIPNVLTVKCYMSYNGQNARDTIVLEDKSDPFQSEIFSTNGDVFKNGQGTTYLIARVFRDGKEYDVIDLYDSLPPTTGVTAGTKIYVKSNDKYYKFDAGAWKTIDAPNQTNGESRFTYTWNRWNENGMADANAFKDGKIAKVTSSNVNQKASFVVTIED